MEDIPENITSILKKIKQNEFEAFLVGGCVRDLVMGKEQIGRAHV
jgi:tRNA nucleotidyltransferase/poly(A) polymerase